MQNSNISFLLSGDWLRSQNVLKPFNLILLFFIWMDAVPAVGDTSLCFYATCFPVSVFVSFTHLRSWFSVSLSARVLSILYYSISGDS